MRGLNPPRRTTGRSERAGGGEKVVTAGRETSTRCFCVLRERAWHVIHRPAGWPRWRRRARRRREKGHWEQGRGQQRLVVCLMLGIWIGILSVDGCTQLLCQPLRGTAACRIVPFSASPAGGHLNLALTLSSSSSSPLLVLSSPSSSISLSLSPPSTLASAITAPTTLVSSTPWFLAGRSSQATSFHSPPHAPRLYMP